MATTANADSKRKYSWWWDSHISPKNSKWLQENLTDMDVKVKQMIKLIEEDADSFARRAEMYYKKRPELMKLVEEFYRAYRALAERYDHATGVLRQAHRTMAEAFPNQVPFMLTDDSPAGSADGEPRTPDLAPVRALFDPDELQKDALGISPSPHSHAVKRNGGFTEESDSVPGRKGLKQLNDLFGMVEGVGRVRKGLNFHDAEEREQGGQDSGKNDIKARVLSDSERVGRAELEILTLKNTLAKLEDEKNAGLLQYQQSLERLSNLELEVSRAKEDSRGLNECASKAEAEVQTLKEALAKLEAEREASFLQYQQCLEKITNLESNISHAQKDAGELNERASKAELEVQSLMEELAKLKAEKEDVLLQYKQCLEKISDLEGKLLHAEEDARRCNERAERAEREVETLKRALAKLTEDKEALAVQYQQCLDTISSLELKLAHAQEEAQRLNSEIDNGVVKLKGAEEKCLLLERSNQTMHSELESLSQKMAAQDEELTEKQKELGRLWTCIQEERLRFVEAETAFQTLQHLHSQSQEELRSMAAELESRAQTLQDLEACNQSLQNEVAKVKVENKGLSEVNLSSALTIQTLQDEISRLRETIGKLEAEVELRLDQRNALQQEIYCLKEELNNLNKKHQAIMEQVESVGLSPESLGSFVKELRDDNINLKEVCERERSEKVALLEKLEIMEKLIEKNALLDNSLSDLNVELEGVRERVRALEESCQSLLEENSTLASEKAALASQFETATDSMEKLTEKNNFLENSLFDANAEVEGLRVKSKSLQDLCMLLENEKSDLATAKGNLISHLDITQRRLEDLEKNYTELEEKYSNLEKERESTLQEVEELRVSLDAQKQEHASLAQLSESRLAGMATQIHLLQEEGQCIRKEYEEELDKAFSAQIEIFVLQKCMQDLEENNFSLLLECQKFLDASKLSEKLISELEHENLEQQVEVKSLYDQIKVLRVGLFGVLKTLELDANQWCEDKADEDQMLVNHTLNKLQAIQKFLLAMQDENQQLVIENSLLVTLLGQLQQEVVNLVTVKNTLDQALASRSEKFLVLHGENKKLAEMNEELRLKIMEGDHTEEVLKLELKNLQGQLLDLQGDYQNLQEENCKVVDEQRSLMKSISNLGEVKCNLEDENCAFFAETVSLNTLSLIFRDIISENFLEIKELNKNLDKLHHVNNGLNEKVKIMEGMLLEVSVVQDEKRELHKMVEDLKCKYDEVELIRADQEKKIIKLCEDCDQQSNKVKCILEAKQELETELAKLNGELLEAKSREESLNYEVQKGRDEIEQGESQAAALFGELQISVVRQALFEGKVYDLCEACESLEDSSYSKAVKIDQLKERASTLECENEELKSQMNSYVGELLEVKSREESLNYEVQKGRDEVEQWESQAAALFGELQISAVQQALFEGKVYDLCEACESLEDSSYSKAVEIDQLKERASTLECENEELKSQMNSYVGELLEVKSREESLNYEVQKGRDEVEQWESQAAALFGELQISAVRQALFEGKVYDLCEACESLEDSSYSKAVEIDQLKERASTLECENEELKSQMNSYVGELLEVKSREESLNYEVQKGRDEVEQWESQAAAVFGELQISVVRQALFEGKVYDLCEACESLEDSSYSKAVKIDQLKERASTLECENEELKSQMNSYVGELLEVKSREESLNYEVQKGRDEVEQWESQAAALFGELQISAVQQALFEGKVYDLGEACESLEDSNYSKAIEMDHLKERASTLERENEELKSQMSSYVPAFISLRDCITSLENCTISQAAVDEVDKEAKDAKLVVHAERTQQINEEQRAEESGELLDLQDLQMRIIAIEEAVMERDRLVILENSSAQMKLEAAVRQIEELKSRSSLLQDGEAGNHRNQDPQDKELWTEGVNNLRLKKQTRKTSEEGNDVMTKDIILDQVSECSSYGISRRETVETDHQMLEIWETTDQDASIDLTVGKPQKATVSPTEKKRKNKRHPSTDSMVEKDVGVDKLEISKRLSGSRQEVNERKILERLDSDAQKLTNLQITVQDLKRKVEITEKNKKGKGIEYDNVKEQLEESEETIMKLFDVNRKLMKSIEDESLSLDEKSVLASDENGSVRRRKLSEQARKGSEKIGRLQLEVQKLQFLLLKLDDENKSRGKTKIIERKTRVLLRDYLYGGTRTGSQKRKKRHFCACVQPPTSGD